MIAKEYMPFDAISGTFSKKDTDYILNKLREEIVLEPVICQNLLSNYNKFTLKNGLDGMVDYLYENFVPGSHGKINDFITIRKDKRGNKKNFDHRLNMNNVKIIKILETIGYLFAWEGDKLATILLNSGKYDGGLKFLMTKYHSEDNHDYYLSGDMLSKLASYFSEKTK